VIKNKLITAALLTFTLATITYGAAWITYDKLTLIKTITPPNYQSAVCIIIGIQALLILTNATKNQATNNTETQQLNEETKTLQKTTQENINHFEITLKNFETRIGNIETTKKLQPPKKKTTQKEKKPQ
jgi:hypothetical protein